MATLRIVENGLVNILTFDAPCPLDALYRTHNRLCGGHGTCRKCQITVSGHVSPPNEREKSAGTRLACQIVLLGDCEITLPDPMVFMNIETRSAATHPPLHPMGERYGIAIDVGTTTLAAQLFHMKTGACLCTLCAPNPQHRIAADVIGRIEAAMGGALFELQGQITGALEALMDGLCNNAAISRKHVDALVVTGNTVMLHFLTGADPTPLSRWPFVAITLFGGFFPLLGMQAYLPPCISAFVGADITCALLSVDQTTPEKPWLLADIGTNGELALWANDQLYTCATAAGPALEGGNIRMGCSAVKGAIDKVWLEDGHLRCHVLGGGKATGICGSGLVDAIAALLKLGVITSSGAMVEPFPLADGVSLFPEDVRQVQLAKAAICAGIETLMDLAAIRAEDLSAFYIAGGFGTEMSLESAAAIGLVPHALMPLAKSLGNAALAGASRIMMDTSCMERAKAICAQSAPVVLGGNPGFNDRYVNCMPFGT